MAQANGWPALFSSAFQQSRNAMMLVNEHRRLIIDDQDTLGRHAIDGGGRGRRLRYRGCAIFAGAQVYATGVGASGTVRRP